MKSRFHPRPRPFFALRLCLLFWSASLPWVLDAAAAGAPAAQPAAAAAQVQAPAAAVALAPAGDDAPLPAGARTYDIPLAQLGANQGLALRGVDGINGVDFGLRRDERVVRARLNLDYAYSPSLLPDLSHIKVVLNGGVAGVIALPKEDASAPRHQVVDLPVPALKEFNRLNLELIGHYTLRCEDPAHSSLWADAGPQGTLELSVVPVDLPDDLALLPVPFFDMHDGRPLELPVVLPALPGARRLEAAGIVSSWFGAMAGYRGARFPVSLGAIPPQGHAVVLVQPGEQPAGVTMPAVEGPTLAVVANPNDPHGKLLLVTGRDDGEIRQAATALALSYATLSGPVARITSLSAVAPRKPYDAPNWLRRDRPVQFGELLPADRFTVQGLRPGPIVLNMRMPPGLFGWHSGGVPVNLRYRYSPRQTATQAVLAVLSGNELLQNLPLRADGESDGFHRMFGMAEPVSHADLRVPTYMLPPLATLQFRYMYEYVKQGECANSALESLVSAIDPTSTIDISGLPSYAAMPDLEAFGDAGFPFTRMADLSETAVILPDRAGAVDYSAYLTLLGDMGESTGYPALGVTVGDAAHVDALRGKDLLVLDSGGNQPLLKRWHGEIPSSLDAGGWSAGISAWLSRALSWRTDDPRLQRAPADAHMAYSGQGEGGILAGFESPLSGGRSVVVVSGGNADGLDEVVHALQINRSGTDRAIRGNLVAVQGGKAVSLLNEQSYYVGHLPPWLAIQWFFTNHSLLLVVALLFTAAVIALLASLALRARARRRLES